MDVTIKLLRNKVRIVPDFPKKGVNFVDVSSITSDAALFHRAVLRLNRYLTALCLPDDAIVVGVESRGFIFGAAIAAMGGYGLALARKKGKLPAATCSQKYSLEYGSAEIEMNKSDIVPGRQYVIVDDIIATGGTISAVEKLITRHGGTVVHALALYGITACLPIAKKSIKTTFTTVLNM